MSEGSSRSSQEGLDGLHGDGRQQPTVRRIQTVPGVMECRSHPPVTRVCTSPHGETERPRLQLKLNPSVTSHLNSQSDGPVCSTQGLLRGSGSDSGVSALNDAHVPPPYNAQHRLAGSQTSALQPPPQAARQNAAQTNSASTTEAQMMPLSQEWQDWQRDRWQIWQLLSSDNADTLPETLV